MSINKRQYNDYYDSIGGWHRVPNEIWEINLDHTCKVIWCYLLSRDSNWDSSRNNIARNLNLHRNTVTLCIEKLENHNMVLKTSPGRQSWDFSILPPTEWKGFDAQSENRAKTEPVPSLCIQDLEIVQVCTIAEPHPRRKRIDRARDDGFENFTNGGESEEHTPGGPSRSHPAVNLQNLVPDHLMPSGNRNPRAAQEKSTQTPFPSSTRRSLEQIVADWKSTLPNRIEISTREWHVSELLDLIKDAGYVKSDLTNKLKSSVVTALMPKERPATTSKDKWKNWIAATEGSYAKGVSEAFPIPESEDDEEMDEDQLHADMIRKSIAKRLNKKG